ncbi:MAG: hypothetical protein AAB480_02275 [Patescibacteria group bacterium]
MPFIDRLAQMWAVSDTLPDNIDLIGVVSFGATATRLSNGSQETIEKAAWLNWICPGAVVAFGEFTKNPVPGVEKERKLYYFPEAVFAGNVISTIEEAEKIYAALSPNLRIQRIVFVTDQWHSRSAKLIWEKVWARHGLKPDIRIVTVPSAFNIDPEHPMTLIRTQWKWALANVLRHAFLLLMPFGFDILKKLNVHQPT